MGISKTGASGAEMSSAGASWADSLGSWGAVSGFVISSAFGAGAFLAR